MQGKVVRLPSPARSQADNRLEFTPASYGPTDREYILDMLEQLARLSAQQGDSVLAAMLDEVLRRRRFADQKQSTTHFG